MYTKCPKRNKVLRKQLSDLYAAVHFCTILARGEPQALAVELAPVEVVLMTEEETEDETDDEVVTSEVVPLVMIVVVVVELGKKSVELTVLEVMLENVVVVVVIGLMVVVIGVDEGPPVHL